MNPALTWDYWFADDVKPAVDPEQNCLEAEAEALVGDSAIILQLRALQGLQRS